MSTPAGNKKRLNLGLNDPPVRIDNTDVDDQPAQVKLHFVTITAVGATCYLWVSLRSPRSPSGGLRSARRAPSVYRRNILTYSAKKLSPRDAGLSARNSSIIRVACFGVKLKLWLHI